MTIAVDFDGTIVEHAYPKIGKPIPFAFDVLKRLQKECQCNLILWSVREGTLLDEAVDFCRKNGLEFYAVNANYPEEKRDDMQSRKVVADLYIDDRSLGTLPDWGVIYRMVKFGETLDEALQGTNDHEPKKRKGLLARLIGN